MESLKELRNKIDTATHVMSLIKPAGAISRYHALALIELERSNNWLTQVFHIMEQEVYPSHEQRLELPEEWTDLQHVEDNRKRIQDALNLIPEIGIKNQTHNMMAGHLIKSLMEAKMWLGNIKDLQMKIESVGKGGGLYVPEGTK